MMRLLIILSIALIANQSVHAQYYYNNILRIRQLQTQLKDYKSNGVKQITMISFDDRGEKMEDFSSTIQFLQQYKTWRSATTSWEGTSITQHQFNEAGQLIQTMDSSLNTKQITQYFYEGELLKRMQLKSYSRGQLSLESIQNYEYAGNTPSRLTVTQKGYDTLFVEFVKDEEGKIVEEKIRKGKVLHQTYYYYYNVQQQLTDIVRHHARSNQLLPDFVFEYQPNGRLASMLVTTDDKRDYQLWKYAYNEKGLKISDVCTGKQNRLIGKVEYQYK
ncbi:hypothetical protein [Gynurincola endophyticus]|uniref:hypothetical protein n=1 Tax=Gynurincola endophyticus TaxID=2479004 RepID=UPI000F8D36D7|nr:hypothetical protein [Gynurincola endophyticus]